MGYTFCLEIINFFQNPTERVVQFVRTISGDAEETC